MPLVSYSEAVQGDCPKARDQNSRLSGETENQAVRGVRDPTFGRKGRRRKKCFFPPILCCAKSLQWRPTLLRPLDCSLPGSSVNGMLQARMPEWVPCHSGDLPTRGPASLASVLLGPGFLPLVPPGSPSYSSVEGSGCSLEMAKQESSYRRIVPGRVRHPQRGSHGGSLGSRLAFLGMLSPAPGPLGTLTSQA